MYKSQLTENIVQKEVEQSLDKNKGAESAE